MGKEILLTRYGTSSYVELFPTYYAANRSLAVLMYERESGEQDSCLTVCLDVSPGKNRAYIDVNNQDPEILEQLVSSGLGKPTGRKRRSGFVEYPEFEFNERILLECGSESYEEYLEWCRKLEEDEEYLQARCRKCSKEFAFIVKRSAAEKYREYLQGAGYLIQDIFPEMTPAQRGLLARGQEMCDGCFKKMLG